MDDAELSMLAEFMGDSPDPEIAAAILLVLLENKSSVVREGAVYGLAKLLKPRSRKIRSALKSVAKNDPSPAVRLSAREALDP